MEIKKFGLIAGFILLGISGLQCKSEKSNELPNILWLSTEDIGPEIGCYGDQNASTPVMDELASRGVLYTRAFANAPVCAPARSTIITGMYAPSVGSQHMRCKGRFPDEYSYYPQILQEHGYYCTNNSKTDYNLVFDADEIWNESGNSAHWRKRISPDQPFFAVFNFTGTHESAVNGKAKHQVVVKNVPKDRLISSEDVTLPPYFPGTPVVKELWARYYNNIAACDMWVEEMLEQLEEDGLAENTIVFFYGDHGAGVPRHKRWLYDSGIRVPLIIYAPEKYKHLIPSEPGTKTDELVSFVDLAPTVLNLAGIEIPDNMQGRAFLGENLSPVSQYIYAARDRMDERYDMQRAVRDKRYKYIRYYDPARAFTQYMNTPEQGNIMLSIRESYANGTLPEDGLKMMLPAKPLEELFDTENDPYELNNLAGDDEYREILETMRMAHNNWSSDIKDAGLIPETILRRWEGQYDLPIYTILRKMDIPVIEIQKVAISRGYETLRDGLLHSNEAVRFWAAYNLGNEPDNAEYKQGLSLLAEAFNDEVPLVRLTAARAFCKMANPEKALQVMEKELKNPDEWVRLFAAQVLDELGETSRPSINALEGLMKDDNKYVVRVANHALNQLRGTHNVVQ